MATSNSYAFTQNRDQIIRRSARLVNAIAQNEIPDDGTTRVFSDALNSMVKNWMAQGLHLWSEQECVLLLQQNQIQYSLGPTSTDNCTTWPIFQTTCNSAATGSTTLILGSITGLLIGDFIGVVLTTGSVYWTTVAATPTTATVTLTAPTTGGVTQGAFVFSYRTRIQRPLRVLAGRRYNWPSAIETSMRPPMARQDYMDMPNKLTTGTPTQFFYTPQLDLGQIYIWPSPVDWSNAVRFTAMRPLQDFVVPGDTPDFPAEWIDPLVFNLALNMAVEYAVNPEQYAMIKERAETTLDTSRGFDREPESIYLGVNVDYRS